ncbi:hypothetical protein, conserved [Eimeria praecox]|uniref:Trimethylguanosine synthase n=1 Tax=Eimeria praecox TaxID=51316 RepID=U6G8P3_9EIME|nr:hypothetical protein, conserved [Eimeria praecox]
MGKGSAIRVADVLAAEVWAYTPPQGTDGVFTGKRQRVKSKEEQRESRKRELFSRFDEGIQLDEEMWWSVTPEQLAVHTAERCRCDLILDGFAGAGGNTIAFAKSCGFVIACELDPTRTEMAKANAAVYGPQVASHVDFIIGDFATLTSRQLRRGALDVVRNASSPQGLKMQHIVVFLAPPWGGPSYNARETFDLSRMGAMIDFGHALRLAQQVAPNVAAFLPRSVCLLPLLRAAALFTLRSEAARAGAASAKGGIANATSPPPAGTAASDFPEDCCGEKTASCQQAMPRMHIELAVCRSRRDVGSLSFDQLGSSESLAHLASGLCRVVGKAHQSSENSPAGSAQEEEEEPNPKRRRVNSIGSTGQVSDQTQAATVHERRWEAAEAAEEEVQLLEGSLQHEPYGALRDFVRENRKAYPQIDDSPREWRWLPVDLLWAAAPLTKGLIKDPFRPLSRRLQAAQEKAQNSAADEETGIDPQCEMQPFLDGLMCSGFPCACRHIGSWRWRAVGLTAFFGPFGDQHVSSQGQVDIAAHGANGVTPGTGDRDCVCVSRLDGPQQGPTFREMLPEGKRLRRAVKHIFTSLLHAVLEFTGIQDPECALAVGGRQMELTQGAQALGSSDPSSNPQPEGLETEVSSNLEYLERAPDSSKEESALCSSDVQPDTQGPLHQGARSIACFARQTFMPCSSSSERLCNCFYSPSSLKNGRSRAQSLSAETEACTSDPGPGRGDCQRESEGESSRHQWRAFARRLVAKASKKVVRTRDACVSGCCQREAGSGAEPRASSKKACVWRSFIWSECSKLVHSYLAAASSHSTTLHLALPRPLSKKRKKRQQASEVPLSAEPLPPMVRQDFLRRIMDAYTSSETEIEAVLSTKAEAKSTGSPAAASGSTDSGIGDQTSENGEAQERGDEDSPGLWTPEEVIHWQFGCSMWCNSALRVLSAQRLAPLLQLHSCAKS